jgi:hypothetical protein
MISAMDTRSAARILDLADESARPRGSRSRAFAGFALILALAAHGAATSGSPRSAQTAVMSPAGAWQASKAQAGESPEMKQLMAIGVAVALTAGASAQDAVQWRVEDGGNGHWYAALQVTPLPSTIALMQQMASENGADLMRIASAAENQLVLSLLQTVGNGESFGMWIGLQRTALGEPWRWTDGTAVGWTGWGSGSCLSGPYPNDLGLPGELGAMIYRQNCGLVWDDSLTAWLQNPPPWWGGTANMTIGLEWSADCNNDGLVDYGQIRAGQLPDANGNNIPDCCENGGSCCPGDTNNDRRVDGIDLATVLTRWGMPGAKFPQADCNADGAIDGTDLAIVLAGWGGCA